MAEEWFVSERRWSKSLIVGGGALFLLGLLDPLEGFPFLLCGLAAVWIGERRANGRRARILMTALVLACVGAVAMVAFTLAGGVGDGSPIWPLLAILPYPVGLVFGVFGILATFMDMRRRELASKSAEGRPRSTDD